MSAPDPVETLRRVAEGYRALRVSFPSIDTYVTAPDAIDAVLAELSQWRHGHQLAGVLEDLRDERLLVADLKRERDEARAEAEGLTAERDHYRLQNERLRAALKAEHGDCPGWTQEHASGCDGDPCCGGVQVQCEVCWTIESAALSPAPQPDADALMERHASLLKRLADGAEPPAQEPAK